MEETAFVTEDRWMKEDGGRLDATDLQILNEASQNGRLQVRVINIKEMFEIMEKTDPKKYREVRKTMEKQTGKPLTFNDLVELAREGGERMMEFTELAKGMTLGEAVQVRTWRIERHMTWRSVARAAFLEGWYNRSWWPPSNQIMGMTLCDKAAQFFQENFREPPWN